MTGNYRDEESGQEYPSWDFFRGTFKNRVERLPDDQCSRDAKEAKMLEGSKRPYATSVAPASWWKIGAGVAPDGTALEEMHISGRDERRNR